MMIILHHLISVLSSGIPWGNSTYVLAYRHVQVYFILINLLLRRSLRLIGYLPVLSEISDLLAPHVHNWRIRRVKLSLVVLKVLLNSTLYTLATTAATGWNKDIICRMTFLWLRLFVYILTHFVVDWVTQGIIFSFGSVRFGDSLRNHCFLSFIFHRWIWHRKWLLRILILWISHRIKAMRSAEATLIALSRWVLACGICIRFRLYFDKVGSLN